MPNPTPIYRVKINNDFLPGYVQSFSMPFSRRTYRQDIINRDGGLIDSLGASTRRLNLIMLIRSEIDNLNGLTNLDNLLDQYQTAASILNRQTGLMEIRVGAQDKYLKGVLDNFDAAVTNQSFKRLEYSVDMIVLPYLYGTAVTDDFSGNGTLSLTLPSTANTYPVFTIPSTVTAFTATHVASGKVVDFVRGAFSGTIVIDCATMTVLQGTVDASRTMNNPNFGIRHSTGAGSFSLAITNYAGSGNVAVAVQPRTEINA